VTEAAEGSYRAVASNAGGSTPSNPATLTVNPTANVPVITQHPESRTVTEGEDVTFQVAATGTAPLSYQWQKNQMDIPGATTAVLELDDVTEADEGSYRAIVSNAAGSATSNPATLTVDPEEEELSIELTSPENGQVFTSPAQIELAAEVESSSAVAKVEFFVGDTLIDTIDVAPYDLTVVDVPAGEYTFTARVTDVDGNTATSDPVSVRVVEPGENVPPVIEILKPRDGAKVGHKAKVVIQALAYDTDGSVVSVEFFDGTTSLGPPQKIKIRHGHEDEDDDDDEGEGPAPPTMAVYMTKVGPLSPGDHVLTAKATDNLGAVTTSEPVTITVKAPKGKSARKR
jgi:hypothetical protein